MGQEQTEPLANGRVLMWMDEQHDFLDQEIDITASDSFPNTMQYVESNEQSHAGKKIIFIQGK